MRAHISTVVILVLAAAALPAGSRQPPLVLRARAMVDVERGRLIEDAAVVIQGGRIVAAGAQRDVPVPADASRLELPGTTLLPGLIDAHVHLTLAGRPADNARATLAAGFTTVQDLGAAAYANVALRDAIRAGRLEGPRIVTAGPWLGVTGGTCDFNGIGVHGADAFRARVREDVAHNVDLIKVCVSGWLAGAVAGQDKYEISDAELKAAIDEAHDHGKRVAVHAISEAGIAAAVRLGADLIAHAGFPSPEVIAVMKKRGVQQLPTLFSFATAKPEHVAAVEAHMRRAVAAGLPVAFGTDAGVIPHGDNAREFESLASIGFDAAAALRTATVAAAQAVGMPKDIGLITPGRLGDVIGVDGNPLEDVRTLQHVSFVMKEGKVVKGPSSGGRGALQQP
jgi:imidazolonepropionase-like amidohydrolase